MEKDNKDNDDEFIEKDNDIEVCKCTVVHTETVDKVKRNMLNEDTMYNLAEFFKVFGDKTRVEILYALSMNEMCVCDMSALLKMSQSAVSHQLKILRQAKLVKYRRDGKVVYYSLDDEHIKGVFYQGLAHVSEK